MSEGQQLTPKLTQSKIVTDPPHPPPAVRPTEGQFTQAKNLFGYEI
jgi:hypothetical protein